MKRLVLLGLLALTGCSDDDGPCPDTGFEIPEEVGEQQQGMRAADADSAGEPVLIRFRPGSQADARDVEAVGGKVGARLPHLSLVAARLTAAQRAALARNPAVESIGPDRKVYAFGLGVPSPGPLLQASGQPPTSAGSVGEVTPGLKLVQANEVWDRNGDGVLDPGAPTGAGIKVCVVDSGLDTRHPELQTAYLEGIDYVDKPTDGGVDLDPSDKTGDELGGGHGTHVAGTIAAQLSNGARVNPKDPTLDSNGIVGVAPGAQLLIARVLGLDGSGRTSDVILAIDWCRQKGAHIVSLSLGAAEAVDAELDAFERLERDGILAVAATGNSGGDQPMAYPAAYGPVMAVGAVETDGGVADFSQSFNRAVAATDGGTGGMELVEKPGSLVAPGTAVQSTMILGRGTAYTEELSVGRQSFNGEGLEYSPLTRYTGRLVDCGLGDSLISCGEAATCEGFVAYVQRGELTFEEKAKNVILQGAKAIIFGNHDPAADATLGFTLGTENEHWVPAVAVTTGAAADIRARAGEEVTLSLVGTDYAVQQGTSMATPHVSAVAALVWSARPSLQASQVRCLLQRTAKDLGTSGYDASYGYGLVQARAALDALEANGSIASDCEIPSP